MRRQPIAFFPLLAVVLPLLAAAAVEGQSDGASGPGQAAPWSVEGSPNPPGRPDTGVRDRDDYWERTSKLEKRSPRLRCQILEVEELGRIYVQEASGTPYWIQLPPEVKIRTIYRKSFDGRKKLTIDDFETGQHLVVTLRDDTDEIVKVMVRPAPETAPSARASAHLR